MNSNKQINKQKIKRANLFLKFIFFKKGEIIFLQIIASVTAASINRYDTQTQTTPTD
jgi:hypothetical protein